MKTRILSALIGIPLLMAILYCYRFFPYCVNILCSLVSLACCVELLNAKKFFRDWLISVPCMLFATALPFTLDMKMLSTAVIVLMIYLFVTLILRFPRYQFDDIAYLLTAVGLSSFGMSSITLALRLDDTHSCFYIILCLAVAWIADGGAYFVGRAMGKKKLCPDISPKKTVEGAIGGVIIGTLGTVGTALVFQYVIFGTNAKVNLIEVAVVGFFGSLLSIIGDLTFSLIKRSCKVKDYGHIIPGHGGLLDRCDSVIMVAPFVYLFALYFPLLHAV